MALRIDKHTAIPWGRNFDEYRRMFALSDPDLGRRILGCSDGPASFNAELTAMGGRVVSADPLYALRAGDIEERIEVARGLVMADTLRSVNDYRWDVIASPEALESTRMGAMRRFLADFRGRDTHRYAAAALPNLPFDDDSFDLTLCSHFLFLYSDQFDLSFHIRSIHELLRVAGEVRIFPIMDLAGRRSAHLAPILEDLARHGRSAHLERVPYEFQIGAFEMLQIQ